MMKGPQFTWLQSIDYHVWGHYWSLITNFN